MEESLALKTYFTTYCSKLMAFSYSYFGMTSEKEAIKKVTACGIAKNDSSNSKNDKY